MFRLKFKADTRQARARLGAYLREVDVGLEDVLYRRARLLAVQLAFVTMPRGFSGAKAKGEKNLEGDVRRCAKDLETFRAGLSSRINHPWFGRLERYLKEGNLTAVDYMIRESKLAKSMSLEPRMQERFHTAQRDRKGHVSNPKRQYLIGAASSLRSYISKDKRNVGAAKGGWATAAAALGGTSGIPRWVSRHAGRSGGHASVRWATKGTLMAEIVNTVSYIDEIMRPAALFEAEATASRKFELHINHVVRNAKNRNL